MIKLMDQYPPFAKQPYTGTHSTLNNMTASMDADMTALPKQQKRRSSSAYLTPEEDAWIVAPTSPQHRDLELPGTEELPQNQTKPAGPYTQEYPTLKESVTYNKLHNYGSDHHHTKSEGNSPSASPASSTWSEPSDDQEFKKWYRKKLH